MDKPQLPKMLKKLHLYLLLLSSLIGFGTYAQTFPISVSTQISQPSPIYLSHYADPSTINSPIKIQLVLNDLTISSRQVKLKIYFQGNGISFSTNDFVTGARPLYLEGGVPLQLTNIDLAPYFEYQNLLGLNPNQYAQPLPEGAYNIYVEVSDFATGKKLSKKTGTSTIIFQNEPPFLNLPLNNASFMQQNIQNIVFSWTPRSINVSNVEYEFSIVEIWDKYTPVQNAFAYSPPLYTTTTRNTTLQYGVSEPQLLPGKKYAWRIKAKAIFGAEEIGVFKNNGYSEIFSFDYESFCTAPLAITTSGVSENQAKITWSGNIDNYDYQINYREKNADSEWYKLVTPRENITISNLKPNATYEYTVGASCDVGKYTHSTIKEFTTLVRDEIAFQGCGIKPDPNDLANKNPLPELFPNDVVTAGDFPIVVLHSTGSNGTFTGDGYVTLPFLEKFRKLIDAADALGGEKINIGQFSRIKITFTNIGVNTDFKLISGEIVASYDKDNWDKMLDADKVFNDVLGSNGKPIEGKISYEVKDAVLNPDGSTTILGANGESTVIQKSVYDQVYTDKNGNIVNIPANGNGEPTFIKGAEGGKSVAANTNGVSSSGEVTQISSPDVTITFEDAPKALYAFDELPKSGPEKLKATYETIPVKGGGTYAVNYKAVSDLNGPDKLIAEAEFKNGKTKDDIFFKTNTGVAVDVKWTSATKAEITVKRTLNFFKESILATVKGAKEKDPKDAAKTIDGKSDIAGKVNIWQLTQKPAINITLLSVNGAKTPATDEAKNFFNEVYNKVGITFDVTTQNVKISGALPNEIQCGESGVFDVYTLDQNNIISAIESSTDFKYNDKTYYVIYTGKSGQNGYQGFMPLGGQYAFVFNNGNLKTAAHELGHGIFGLKHPFSTEAESRKTDLLMDYGDGTVLSHNDWDIIHSGGWKFYGFQKSADGALLSGLWYTTSWKAFVGKKEYIPVVETSGNLRPEGTIRRIYIAKENAYYTYFPEKGDYYKDKDTIRLKIDTSVKLSNSSKNPVYLYKYEGGCGKDTYYKSTHDIVMTNKNNINKLLQTLKPEGVFSCGKPSLEDLKDTGKEIYAYNKSQVPEKDVQILIEIASIGDIIGKDNYNSYITKLRNDGNLFWSNVNKSAPYTTENLNNTLKSLKDFSDAIQRIKTHNYTTIESLIEDVDSNFKITKGSDNIFVFPSDMRLTRLLTTPFADLDAKRSKDLIDLIENARFITNHNIGDPICAEQILTVILDKVAKGNDLDKKKQIINHIRAKKYLFHFINGISGIYYESFINSMILMTHQVYPAPEFRINPAKYLTFSPAYLKLNSESISIDGKVELKVKQWFSENLYNIVEDPYEYVTVNFADDVNFGGNFQFKKNQTVQMSAICAYQLFHKDTRAAQWKSAKIAGEVALTVVGVGEITAAIRLYRAGRTAYATYLGLKALGDVGFGLTDVYINNSDNSLTDAQKEKWNKFFMIYSIASISTTGLEIATNKVMTKLNKGGNSYNEFENAVEEADIDIDQLYKDNIENPIRVPGSFEDQIKLLSKDDRIPATLKKLFEEDFANAGEEVVKLLQKEDSGLLNGWVKYRKKNPTAILCN
ncbi:fibronectin type III domain-containing protein [Flavobacterium fluviatile]|uniref:fibronectin type III domain-containing protein n=1 Tax=Flavobacterium fluviatile TaxID=1862387 RepID=UPI0013D86816|nr:fibronectin type III domain-containing protein [Flavobacterium fluviatile]